MWASGAPEAHVFLCLICLRESNLINFWRGSTRPTQKSPCPPFSKIKKVHTLSPSIVQILVPHFSKIKKVYAPPQIL